MCWLIVAVSVLSLSACGPADDAQTDAGDTEQVDAGWSPCDQGCLNYYDGAEPGCIQLACNGCTLVQIQQAGGSILQTYNNCMGAYPEKELLACITACDRTGI